MIDITWRCTICALMVFIPIAICLVNGMTMQYSKMGHSKMKSLSSISKLIKRIFCRHEHIYKSSHSELMLKAIKKYRPDHQETEQCSECGKMRFKA